MTEVNLILASRVFYHLNKHVSIWWSARRSGFWSLKELSPSFFLKLLFSIRSGCSSDTCPFSRKTVHCWVKRVKLWLKRLVRLSIVLKFHFFSSTSCYCSVQPPLSQLIIVSSTPFSLSFFCDNLQKTLPGFFTAQRNKIDYGPRFKKKLDLQSFLLGAKDGWGRFLCWSLSLSCKVAQKWPPRTKKMCNSINF